MRKKKSIERANFLDTNRYTGFKYCLDIDYDTDEDPDCKHNYCSCRTLVNIRVTNVDFQSILGKVILEIDPPIVAYAIDRILRIYKVYDRTKWTAEAESDYYGEVVGPVCLEGREAVQEAIDFVTTPGRHPEEIVEYLLALEYGHLLPGLKGLTWTIETVKAKEVLIPHADYMRKLSVTGEQIYADWDGVVAVTVACGGGYKLIDGYHRFTVNKKKEIQVLVGR